MRIDDIKRYGVDMSAASIVQALEGSALNLTLGRVSDGGNRYTAIAKGAIGLRRGNQRTSRCGQPRPCAQPTWRTSCIAQRPAELRDGTITAAYAVGLVIQKTSDANTVEVVDQVHCGLRRVELQDPSMDWTRGHAGGTTLATRSENGLGRPSGQGGIASARSWPCWCCSPSFAGSTPVWPLALAIPVLGAHRGRACCTSTVAALNILSMMGLMLAAGMLVDNAVVVLEVHLPETRNAANSTGSSRLRRGAGEVSVAVDGRYVNDHDHLRADPV